MLAFAAVAGAIGYLAVACVVAAVLSATNWFGMGSERYGVDAAGVTVGATFWPVLLVAAVVLSAVLGPFLLCRLIARRLAMRLNPDFDGWAG